MKISNIVFIEFDKDPAANITINIYQYLSYIITNVLSIIFNKSKHINRICFCFVIDFITKLLNNLHISITVFYTK